MMFNSRLSFLLAQVPGLGFVDDSLTSFLEWVEDTPGLGALAFAAVYVFTTVCFIPGALLTLGAGLVFGRALGTGLGVLVGSLSVLVSIFFQSSAQKGASGCARAMLSVAFVCCTNGRFVLFHFDGALV